MNVEEKSLLILFEGNLKKLLNQKEIEEMGMCKLKINGIPATYQRTEGGANGLYFIDNVELKEIKDFLEKEYKTKTIIKN